MSHKLPSDIAYEHGMTFGNARSHIELNGQVWDGINWSQDITRPPEQRDLTTAAATQFHYANMSHLILCGKVLKNELPPTSLDLQKLAVCLSSHKAENIDLWGRYLEKTGAGMRVHPRTKAYYRQLFSEQDALPLFLGMETLSGAAAKIIYDSVRDKGDALFNQAATNMVTQKETEQQLTIDHLEPLITDSDEDSRQQLQKAAEQYRHLITQLLTAYRHELNNVGIDLNTFQQAVTKEIDAFHTALNIPQ